MQFYQEPQYFRLLLNCHRMKTQIRQATKDDLPDILRVFGSSIQAIPNAHYTQAQKPEWLKSLENKKRWTQALTKQLFWVAEVNRELVGFISLEVEKSYIDFLYAAPNFWGQGVAKELLQTLQDFALLNKLSRLRSDVSITARPFFEHHGFRANGRNEHLRGNQVLVNFSMTKVLTNT